MSRKKKRPIAPEPDLNAFEYWQAIPARDRPKNLHAYPGGLSLFRSWRNIRWFLIFLLPPLASSAAFGLRGGRWVTAVVFLVFQVLIAASLFVDLGRGMVSSNWGTYYRKLEPFQYWHSIGFQMLIYSIFCVMGYFAS